MYEIASVKDWFDSPYYQLLQKKEESIKMTFLQALLDRLQPAKGSKFLHIGCNTGELSSMIAEKDFNVTGIDYSFKLIQQAKETESETLQFYQHDIKLPFWINYFNYAICLFNNFGYYRTLREHDNSIRTIARALLPNGLFVLDYLNVHFEENLADNDDEFEINNINFRITTVDEDEMIVKKIEIMEEGESTQVFEERYQKFSIGDLTDMFAYQGLQIQEVYGDYSFGHYDIYKSPRLILIAEKMKR